MFKKYIVECDSCCKEVNVRVSPFGKGYVGICPKCHKLAYNSKKLPEKEAPSGKVVEFIRKFI